MALTTNQPAQPESSKLSGKKRKKAIEQSPTKQKRPSSGTIGVKLLVLVLGSTILGLGASGYLYYQELTKSAQQQIEKNLGLQVSDIDGKLAPVQQSALDLAASVKALHAMGIKDAEIYKKMVFEHFKRLNVAIALGIGQTSNALVTDRKWYYPSFYRELPNAKVDLKTVQRLPAPNADAIYADLFEADNYPDKKYWRESTASEESLWLEPYETSNGTIVTAYVAPLYSDTKKLLGVARADASVASLTEKMGGNVLGNAGNFIVLSRTGSLLSYPPEPNKAKARESYETIPELKAVWAQIQDKKSGIVQVEGKYYAFQRINRNGWLVLAVLPQSYILEQVLPIAVGTAAGVGILLTLIVILFVRSLNRRLRPIINECEKLVEEAGGELPVQKSKDEIAHLDASFKTMVAQLANHEERIKQEVTIAVLEQERLNLAKAAERESEILEGEIGALLDVVSSLEEGDLTVEAEVSDRATGLVADTLNRLRERLSHIISSVLGTAQRVADGAEDLEKLAKTVAENTVNQAQSVAEGRALTEQVALSAQNSASEVQIANQALQDVQATVATGQGAIEQLTAGITVLQKGSAQIVQRMKTLGEFVGLAEQFVQDQSQIASLTQVLAINATLVAARAAEQKDPKQFTSVAREFEAIAGQVNDLATQTNDGLTVLRQRTSQIQSVVSAVDAEVQNLGGLVAGFTSGVEQSQLAFNSVQNTTTEVVEVGQRVTESSLEIAVASDSTAKYMSEIATLAQRTADLTANAREQAEQMGDLAQSLLEGIRFFQLPDMMQPSSDREPLALNLDASSTSPDTFPDTLVAFQAKPELESEPSVELKLETELQPDEVAIAQQDADADFSPNALLEDRSQTVPLVPVAIAATGLLTVDDTTTPQIAEPNLNEYAIGQELVSVTDETDELISSELLQGQVSSGLDSDVELSVELGVELDVDSAISLDTIPEINLETPLESNHLEIAATSDAKDVTESDAFLADISTDRLQQQHADHATPEDSAPKRNALEDDFRGFNLLKPIVLSRPLESKAPKNTSKSAPKSESVEPSPLTSKVSGDSVPAIDTLELNAQETSISGLEVSEPETLSDVLKDRTTTESFNLIDTAADVSEQELDGEQEIEIDASYLDAMADLAIDERFDAMMIDLDLEATETPLDIPQSPQSIDFTDDTPTDILSSIKPDDPRLNLANALVPNISLDADSEQMANLSFDTPDLEVEALVETLANDLEEAQAENKFESASDFADDVIGLNLEDEIFPLSPDLDLYTLDTPNFDGETSMGTVVNGLEIVGADEVGADESDNIFQRFSSHTDPLASTLSLDDETLPDPVHDRLAFQKELDDSMALLREIESDFNAPVSNHDSSAPNFDESSDRFLSEASGNGDITDLPSDLLGYDFAVPEQVLAIDDIQEPEIQEPEIQESELDQTFTNILSDDLTSSDDIASDNLDRETPESFSAGISMPQPPTSDAASFDGLKSFSDFSEDIDFNDLPMTGFDDLDEPTLGMPTDPIPVVYLDPSFSFEKEEETSNDDEFNDLLDLNFDEVGEITLDGSNLIEQKDEPELESESEPAQFAGAEPDDGDSAVFFATAAEEILDISGDVSSDGSIDDFSAFNVQLDDEFDSGLEGEVVSGFSDESADPLLEVQADPEVSTELIVDLTEAHGQASDVDRTFIAPSLEDLAQETSEIFYAADVSIQQTSDPTSSSFDGLKSFSDFGEDIDFNDIPMMGFGDLDDEPTLGMPTAPIPVAYLDPSFSFEKEEETSNDDEFNDLLDLNFDEVTEITLDGSNLIEQKEEPEIESGGSEEGDRADLVTTASDELSDTSLDVSMDDFSVFNVQLDDSFGLDLGDAVTSETGDESADLSEFQTVPEVSVEFSFDSVFDSVESDIQEPDDQELDMSQPFTGTPYGDSDQDTSGFFSATMPTSKEPTPPISTFDGLRSFSSFDEDVDFNDFPVVELDDIPDLTLGAPTAPIPVAYLDPNFSFDQDEEVPNDDEFKDLLDLNFDEVTEITLDGSNLIEQKDEPAIASVSDNRDSEVENGEDAALEHLLDSSDDTSTTLQSDRELTDELTAELGIEMTFEVGQEPTLVPELEANTEQFAEESINNFQGLEPIQPLGENLYENSDQDTSGFFAIPMPSIKPKVDSMTSFASLSNFDDEEVDMDALPLFDLDQIDEPAFGAPSAQIPTASYKESDFRVNTLGTNVFSHDVFEDTFNEPLDGNFDDVFDVNLGDSNAIAKETDPKPAPKQAPKQSPSP
ncbi:hypothetical protein V2H45_04490 [Tumidithrix elongata RA019]|uniref:Methyl-accepting chemotaxis protein n=1 Tax=Tumidithrix elongata BACA0141 TaxID=2716417 RepID=A0AAW9PYL8_9CYAN|nr:hypothetical protein [Tumidithrix elongata RA019]